jgi:hypothetical protein
VILDVAIDDFILAVLDSRFHCARTKSVIAKSSRKSAIAYEIAKSQMKSPNH